MAEQEAIVHTEEEVAETTVEHALLTADGTAVPVTFNPETGEYTTADGQPVIIQQEGDATAEQVEQLQMQQVHEEIGLSQHEEVTETTSDLSSLAAAAETHSTLATNEASSSSAAPLLQDIRILNPDGTLSQLTPEMAADQQVKIISAATGEEAILQQHQIMQPAQQMVQQAPQQIRIINSDGTVSIGNAVPQGAQQMLQQQQHQQQQQQQQIRIVKMDPQSDEMQFQQAAQVISEPQLIAEQPQIRILNADGTVSNLSGNIRVISSNQIQQQGVSLATPQMATATSRQQVRVVRSAGGNNLPQSPTRAISLTQAQQMGLLSPGKLKNIRISPVKSGVTHPAAVSTTMGDVRQVALRPGGSTMATTQQQPTQQVIRIASSSLGQQQITPGSIQQINMGGKLQYVRVIGAAGQQSPKRMVPTGIQLKPGTQKIASKSSVQRVIFPSTSKQEEDIKPVVKQPGSYAYEAFLNRKDQNRVVPPPTDEAEEAAASAAAAAQSTSFEPLGVRPRKPCNCTKSQCLKLYCDCFANGEFCNNCNCNGCFNNLDHEEERQKQIKTCLDRNSNAFKPKIGRLAGVEGNERRHNKGCHCKRSGCLKNYCECYEAKIPCTDACRCLGCKNVEDEPPATKKGGGAGGLAKSNAATVGNLMRQQQIEQQYVPIKPSLKNKLAPALTANGFKSASGEKQAFSFITPEVVEATCQCLLAQAEEAERAAATEGTPVSEKETEALILEEFGRCLSQIIDISNKDKTAGGETALNQ